jgi:transposase
MDNRIISLNDWFENFTERILTYTNRSATTKELFQRFAFSLYQLMYCGFIIRSRRKQDAFEKAVMVWAAS